MPEWKRETLPVKKTPWEKWVFFSFFGVILILIGWYFLQPIKLWQQYQDYRRLNLAKSLVNGIVRFHKTLGFFPWAQTNAQFQAGVETASGDYYYNSDNESDNFYWLQNLPENGILTMDKVRSLMNSQAFYIIKSANLKQVEVCFAPVSTKYQAQIGHWCGEKETQSSLAAAGDFHQFTPCAKETPLNIFANENQLICFNQVWE